MSDPSTYYTDKKTIHILYKMFYDIHNTLLRNNVPYIASGGTLIGAVRHKGIIPWDNDIDIAVYEKDVPIILSKSFKNEMKKKNCNVVDTRKRMGWIKIEYSKNKKISCDIFILKFMKKNGENILVHNTDYVRKLWPKDYYPVKDVFPLTEYKFGSLIVLGPKNYKQYLDHGYGKTWSKVGFITQAADTHYDLDEPIRLKVTKFTPAKNFYIPSKTDPQVRLRKGCPLLCKWDCK